MSVVLTGHDLVRADLVRVARGGDRVSLDQASVARMTAARGASLGARVVAIELTVATQATQLRGTSPRGVGTARAAEIVRRHVPFLAAGDLVPDVEPLAAAVQRGELTGMAAS